MTVIRRSIAASLLLGAVAGCGQAAVPSGDHVQTATVGLDAPPFDALVWGAGPDALAVRPVHFPPDLAVFRNVARRRSRHPEGTPYGARVKRVYFGYSSVYTGPSLFAVTVPARAARTWLPDRVDGAHWWVATYRVIGGRVESVPGRVGPGGRGCMPVMPQRNYVAVLVNPRSGEALYWVQDSNGCKQEASPPSGLG